ncbi:uncharacterized protein LOC110453238 [Mizuhopecten yessoensis]|uniref:Uncharacterized protein n=1 Tax=Mizuhopecten yessoensis TaxID=6573 RepID=A0A210QHT2_MIZYE|nr:uncharacterized protein LOC110453238 [Mizuhopecten yessoensis]OWF48314.1 hypothetical protein KP79_PYT11833 [Mizuhopecten yessoensis]
MLGLTSILQEEESSDNVTLLTQIKQEAPYDSGYLSPGPLVQRSVIPSGQMALLSQTQTSPVKPMIRQRSADHYSVDNLQKPPVYEDVGISEEWEKDFFANFEENLFSLDLDEQVLDDILKSPKGKVALNEIMNSPKGKAIMNSPKGKKLKERMRLFDTAPGQEEFTTVVDHRLGILSPADTNKPGITPMKPDAQRALKMSKRKLSMGTINQPLRPSFTNSLPTLAPATNENSQPVTWPSQERLKFARSNFKDILKKAVMKVESAEAAYKTQLKLQQTAAATKTNRRQKGKSDKYPQLSKALSRPSIPDSSDDQQPMRKSERKSHVSSGMLLSGCQLQDDWYNPEEDDDDEDWQGDLPFTGFKQATKRRKKIVSGQSKRRKSSHNTARYVKY